MYTWSMRVSIEGGRVKGKGRMAGSGACKRHKRKRDDASDTEEVQTASSDSTNFLLFM